MNGQKNFDFVLFVILLTLLTRILARTKRKNHERIHAGQKVMKTTTMTTQLFDVSSNQVVNIELTLPRIRARTLDICVQLYMVRMCGGDCQAKYQNQY